MCIRDSSRVRSSSEMLHCLLWQYCMQSFVLINKGVIHHVNERALIPNGRLKYEDGQKVLRSSLNTPNVGGHHYRIHRFSVLEVAQAPKASMELTVATENFMSQENGRRKSKTEKCRCQSSRRQNHQMER
eukprot:TRINITY_DN4484_c0_g1_i1.p1 TRINITY_DN4484_c0_g1~~TRINITY_DN4484_c0_g1_i1.p1  ORF type:complete len:130 (+),score=3.00 TRINITY_DN4484_c0_g1_i1:64-453(+)